MIGACTNRLLPSFPLNSLLSRKIKRFKDKPFRPILSKWAIFITGFPYEIAHIEEWFPSWTYTSKGIKFSRVSTPFLLIDHASTLRILSFITVIDVFLPYSYHYVFPYYESGLITIFGWQQVCSFMSLYYALLL